MYIVWKEIISKCDIGFMNFFEQILNHRLYSSKQLVLVIQATLQYFAKLYLKKNMLHKIDNTYWDTCWGVSQSVCNERWGTHSQWRWNPLEERVQVIPRCVFKGNYAFNYIHVLPIFYRAILSLSYLSLVEFFQIIFCFIFMFYISMLVDRLPAIDN